MRHLNYQLSITNYQPPLSDFGLYKCPLRGKMVMGYEKEKHQAEGHKGVQVEWKRLK